MTIINRLIRLNIELEGLLRVLENRDSEELRQIICEKFEEYSSLMGELKLAVPTEPQSISSAESLKEIVEKDITAPDLNSVQRTAQELPLKNTEEVVMPKIAAYKTVVTSDGNKPSLQSLPGIKLDELLSLRESADLKKAFTLNDKFRFRRELFGGNAEDFDDTLNIISEMSDFSEARQYLGDDLQWDLENPEAKDFLDVIEKHFNSGAK